MIKRPFTYEINVIDTVAQFGTAPVCYTDKVNPVAGSNPVGVAFFFFSVFDLQFRQKIFIWRLLPVNNKIFGYASVIESVI